MTNLSHPEELISASITGDLTDAERGDLDRHLASCARCRQTLASFAADRQLLTGLRRESAPRDLGARVRTGVASGRSARPGWWRPSSLLAGALSIVAVGALGGIALANGWFTNLEVASTTQTPIASVAATPASSAVASETPAPSGTPEATPSPTPTPEPLAGQVGNGYINYLQLSGAPADLTMELGTYDPVRELSEAVQADFGAPRGAPLAISLAPSYGWIAYQTRIGEKGTSDVWAYNLADARTVLLGETEDSAFGRRMSWSTDGRFLAFTIVDFEQGDGPDAAIFDTQGEEVRTLTDTDDLYAGSFDGERLWLSRAAASPTSYLVPLDGDLGDLEAAAIRSVPDAFMPLLAPDGSRVIAWGGEMAAVEPGWAIASAGMLYLAEYDGGFDMTEARQLFADIPVEQNALVAASVSWSFDSDWFAVWGAAWEGTPLSTPDARFPDGERVYVGQATGSLITSSSTAGPSGAIVDVTYVDLRESPFSSDLPTIAVTQQLDAGAEGGGSAATAKVLLTAAGGSDSSLEIGDGTSWAGPVFYVPQGDEGR